MQHIFEKAPYLNGALSVTPFLRPNPAILPPLSRAGLNLAGAEFGSEFPGTYDKTYTYPTTKNLDYHRSRGRTLVRLPFRWERIQHALFAPFDASEVARLHEFLDEAVQREINVILDVHNYGRYVFPRQGAYDGTIIGSEELPYAAFADVWRRLAEEFAHHPAVCAYGLMNEPHDMEGAERWPNAAQAAIDAIRAVDAQTTILVPGDDWTSSRNWRLGANEYLAEKLHDPQDNLMFEAHCYFDRDNSGTYKLSYEDEGGSPEGGVEYVRPFIEWCQEKGVRGFLGEYGIPDNDSRWLVTMDQFLAYLQKSGVGSAYWAGGPWWQDNFMAIEPHATLGKAADRPQMLVLRQYEG